jgi:hypothetical protein
LTTVKFGFVCRLVDLERKVHFRQRIGVRDFRQRNRPRRFRRTDRAFKRGGDRFGHLHRGIALVGRGQHDPRRRIRMRRRNRCIGRSGVILVTLLLPPFFFPDFPRERRIGFQLLEPFRLFFAGDVKKELENQRPVIRELLFKRANAVEPVFRRGLAVVLDRAVQRQAVPTVVEDANRAVARQTQPEPAKARKHQFKIGGMMNVPNLEPARIQRLKNPVENLTLPRGLPAFKNNNRGARAQL